jgi:hypothetical protein
MEIFPVKYPRQRDYINLEKKMQGAAGIFKE